MNMANIFEFLSKDGNITPEKARKSRQMQFHDKTAYVWGLRYRWDPSPARNPVSRFPHFMPPWSSLEHCYLLFLKGWLVSLAFKRIIQQRWSTRYKWRSHLKSSSLLSNPKVSRTRLEITPVLKCIGGDKSFTSYSAAHWSVGDCAGQPLMWEKSLRCHQAEIRLHHEWSKRPSDPRDGHQP